MIKEKAVFPMMKHTELINVVAEKIEAERYLEIGVYNTAHNFDRIRVKGKVSVDPNPEAGAIYIMTSDQFFERVKEDQKSGVVKMVHDIIFIDGLHHSEQVKKDIINSWGFLRDGGVIIIHDTNPHSEHITHVPRDNREWCGNIYQAIAQIESPEIFTLKDDYGVTVIRKTGELKMNDDVITWEEFDLFRNDILNLKSWDEVIKIIDSW